MDHEYCILLFDLRATVISWCTASSLRYIPTQLGSLELSISFEFLSFAEATSFSGLEVLVQDFKYQI